MSIYIKGMEMPKNCYGCCFFHQVDYWNRDNEADILSCCKRTGEKTFDDFIKYLPNCPLVPVPPHGRLIDADATEIYKREELALARYNENQDDEFLEGVKDGWHEAAKCLSCAPTIIEAEEGE